MQKIREDEDSFEKELAQSLRRVPAPMGFAERLGRAVERESSAFGGTRHARVSTGRLLAFPQRAWLGGAMAAGLVLACFGAGEFHVRRERERVTAERNFEVSQQITEHALEHTREQLQRAGIDLELR